MLKSFAVTIAAGALSIAFVAGASALPLTPSNPAAPSDEVTLVRDGCGPGLRYSVRLRRCVGVERPVVIGPVRVCPPFQRWSERFRRCVPL
jgi:hypothetical protein